MSDIPHSYITIANEFRTEYIIEKSRFIATIAPVSTEEEAQAFMQRISKEFWDATHNCTAYAIGPRQEQQRSSDNGEPSGTAGKPMLEVLKKTTITNVAVVVTRYFGGIKLGAGGLIRAYSHSVAKAVQEGPKLLIAPRQIVSLTIDYSYFGSVERQLQTLELPYQSTFTDTISLEIYVEPSFVSELETTITNLTGGNLLWELQDIRMVELPYSFSTAEE
ncbi:YigZ family protein [Veillonella sp. CHU740]|uniref:YigZ family protein n=1 Tax=Veillonella sp. CHU740 TaxID=2490950 RepID=UPI000F8CDA25|nr:YigZ family protein [Veillonella sp. CHU740]